MMRNAGVWKVAVSLVRRTFDLVAREQMAGVAGAARSVAKHKVCRYISVE